MRVAELDSLSGYAGIKSAMTYTSAGQLYYALTPQSLTGPYDHAWHWYDATGQRVMTHLALSSTLGHSVRPDTTWGNRTFYVNDGSDVAFTLVKPGNTNTWRIQQRYLATGLDEAAAARLYVNGTPTNVAIIGDRQNTYIMAVNGAGTEQTQAGFYVKGPFGLQESGTTAASGDAHTGLGFAGAGAPTTSGGYVYMRNRWYDPQTGRFLSQDPIGLAGGVNLYAYAGNNPTTYADPFGLAADTIEVQTHPVVRPAMHALIRITPDNQDRWKDDPRFKLRDANGRAYMTLGAGPIGPRLVSEHNRDRDTRPHAQGVVIVPGPAGEDALIEKLLELDGHYSDQLQYALSGFIGHNSNSYVAGLLRAAGLAVAKPSGWLPGWNNPVSAHSFGR